MTPERFARLYKAVETLALIFKGLVYGYVLLASLAAVLLPFMMEALVAEDIPVPFEFKMFLLLCVVIGIAVQYRIYRDDIDHLWKRLKHSN